MDPRGVSVVYARFTWSHLAADFVQITGLVIGTEIVLADCSIYRTCRLPDSSVCHDEKLLKSNVVSFFRVLFFFYQSRMFYLIQGDHVTTVPCCIFTTSLRVVVIMSDVDKQTSKKRKFHRLTLIIKWAYANYYQYFFYFWT